MGERERYLYTQLKLPNHESNPVKSIPEKENRKEKNLENPSPDVAELILHGILEQKRRKGGGLYEVPEDKNIKRSGRDEAERFRKKLNKIKAGKQKCAGAEKVTMGTKDI